MISSAAKTSKLILDDRRIYICPREGGAVTTRYLKAFSSYLYSAFDGDEIRVLVVH